MTSSILLIQKNKLATVTKSNNYRDRSISLSSIFGKILDQI